MHQGEGVKEGVCVILYWLADATREALKAMAGQAFPPRRHCVGLPALVCMLVQRKEREREEVYGVEEVLVCVVCVFVSTYFLRSNVFSVHRFLARCMGVVMGRFVPLALTAFLLGGTSNPEEEVEEGEDEEEEELLASSEDAKLSLPRAESGSPHTLIPQSLHPPLVSIPNPGGQARLQCKMPRCQPHVPPSR